MKLTRILEQERKRRRALGWMTACCLLGTGSAFAFPEHEETAKPSKPEQSAAKAPSVSEFISGAIDASQAELRAGQTAVQRAQSPTAKQLGQTLVKDHKEIHAALVDLAAKKSVAWKSSLPEQHDAAIQKLSAASGSEFDRQFVRMILKDHERDLAMINECKGKFSGDHDLQALINKYQPTLERHLKMAREAALQLGVQVSDRQTESSAGAAAATERGSGTDSSVNRNYDIDGDADIDARVEVEDADNPVEFKTGDGEVLGLPTSNNDGTILGVIPAPSREVEAGSTESYIAEELANGKVNPDVDNVFQADQDTVTAPNILQRDEPASEIKGRGQIPAQLQRTMQERGWNVSEVDVKRVTGFELQANGERFFATPDGKVYRLAE